MPNWCSTKYVFRGDEDEIKILNDKIKEWTSKNYVENGFGKSWLGNILYGAGLGDCVDNPENVSYLRCRGTLEDIGELYGNSFEVWTETAWVPMAKMWNAVIKKLELKTVGFTFEAEESGCGLYWIYDPLGYGDFASDEIYIDSFGNYPLNEMSGYYREQDAIEELNSFFKTNFKFLDDFYQLCNDYNEKHEDDFINFHRFEIDNELWD